MGLKSHARASTMYGRILLRTLPHAGPWCNALNYRERSKETLLASTPHTLMRLVHYRWLLYELVLRDLRVRYRGSALGLAWTLLNPILFMVIYTLVFSVYLRVPIKAYPLFLLSGLIPWTWLAGALQQGTSAILDGRMYVGKTAFPIEVLLAVPVLSNAVNFVFSLPLLIVVAIALKVHLGYSLIALPLVVAIELVLTFALVQITATLNVYYRDLQQLVVYVLTALFYVTPIFYTANEVPARFAFLLQWNPFAALMGCFQDIFYYGILPKPGYIAFSGAAAILLLLVAQGLYLRNRETFTQYL